MISPWNLWGLGHCRICNAGHQSFYIHNNVSSLFVIITYNIIGVNKKESMCTLATKCTTYHTYASIRKHVHTCHKMHNILHRYISIRKHVHNCDKMYNIEPACTSMRKLVHTCDKMHNISHSCTSMRKHVHTYDNMHDISHTYISLRKHV